MGKKFPPSSLDYLLFFASASKTAFVNGLVVLSAKDAASSAANYAGHQHFAKFGGLPVNNGSSTSYTQGGSNPNFGQAYANITGAKK